MPFSARTRPAIRQTFVTLAAALAILGIAGTASATGPEQAPGTSATVQSFAVTVMPACASCGTGF